jgi:hypothetical protein
LIAGALVLVSAVAGWYLTAGRSATGEIDKSGDLSVLDLRVGDCFDDRDPSADQTADVKAVPCTTEHEYEVFYIGAMGDGSYPTGEAFETYMNQNCNPAFDAYIGKAYDDADLDILPDPDRRFLGVGRSDREVRRLPSGDPPPDTVAPGHAAVSHAVGPLRATSRDRVPRISQAPSPRVL